MSISKSTAQVSSFSFAGLSTSLLLIASLLAPIGCTGELPVGWEATAFQWDASGAQEGALFGWSVANAGDVDGDEFADVLIGAPKHDHLAVDGGAVFLYSGSATGLSVEPSWASYGTQSGEQFGFAVAGAGDVNGDGFADVIIGAPFFDDGEVDEGGAFVFLGSASGLSNTPAAIVAGNQQGASFGWSVAGIGDVDGDTFGDVIVGAPDFDDAFADEGVARVFQGVGGLGGIQPVPIREIPGAQEGAAMGFAVAGGGYDLDSDLIADYAVGAPYFDTVDRQDAGQMRVFRGGNLAVTAPVLTVGGPQEQAAFGASIALVADVNGDDFDEVVVGAYLYNDNGDDVGYAALYSGQTGGVASAPLWTSVGRQAGDYRGFALAGVDDLNGDGFGDVVVGQHGAEQGQESEGGAVAFRGSGTGPQTSLLSPESNQTGSLFGSAVAGTGTGFLVGAYGYDGNGLVDAGRVFLYDFTSP